MSRALTTRLGLLLLVAAVGCGGVGVESSKYDTASGGADVDYAMEESTALMEGGDGEMEFVSIDEADVGGEAVDLAKVERKIVYRSTVQLRVENFDGLPDQVLALAKKHGGFVKDSSLDTVSRQARSGEWTLRVPVDAYEAFLEEARGLGDLQNLSTTSEEVTAEFYDVEARIRNKQKEEARLLVHLDDSTGKLEDILAVERELTRVREELERLQGRMRVLRELTSLTTVTLVVREIRDYVPPESPTFGTRIARSFGDSVLGLREFGENLVIGAVGLVPWLPVLALGVGFLWFLKRRIWPRRAST